MESTNFMPTEHPLKTKSRWPVAIAALIALVILIGLVVWFLLSRPEEAPAPAPELPAEEEAPAGYVPPEYRDNLDQAFADLEEVDL